MSAIVISTAALAVSASNSARIDQHKTEACILYVKDFDSRTSSTKQQKQYAECVQRLNPEPMSANEHIFFKGCIVVLLISMVVGAIIAKRDTYNSWFDIVMYAILAPCIVGCAGLILMLIAGGIMFLVS